MEKDGHTLMGENGVNPYKSTGADRKNYLKFNNNIRRSFLCWLKDFTCETCNFYNPTKTLHFHHVYPKKKQGSIMTMVGGKNKMKLFKEIFKCVYVCENCHYKIHSEEGGIDGHYEIINRRRHSYIQNLLGSSNRSSMG